MEEVMALPDALRIKIYETSGDEGVSILRGNWDVPLERRMEPRSYDPGTPTPQLVRLQT